MAIGYILRYVVWILGVTRLFNFGHTLKWCSIDSGGIQLIAINETFYQLMNKALCLQFHDAFFSHLLPQQFSVIIRGRCEVVVHGIHAALNVDPD